MSRCCKVCQRNDLNAIWTEVTIASGGAGDQVHSYCPECASRYLDTLDMYGMTLDLLKGIRTAQAVA